MNFVSNNELRIFNLEKDLSVKAINNPEIPSESILISPVIFPNVVLNGVDDYSPIIENNNADLLSPPNIQLNDTTNEKQTDRKKKVYRPKIRAPIDEEYAKIEQMKRELEKKLSEVNKERDKLLKQNEKNEERGRAREAKQKEREKQFELKKQEKELKFRQRELTLQEKESKLKEKEMERLKIEDEKQKKREKELADSAKFKSFFVSKSPSENLPSIQTSVFQESRFTAFQVKQHMTLASLPYCKIDLEEIDRCLSEEKQSFPVEKHFKHFITTRKFRILHKSNRSKIICENNNTGNNNIQDLIWIDDPTSMQLTIVKYKLLQFAENQRPPYFGTFSKFSKLISPRNPFSKDEAIFDYEVII